MQDHQHKGSILNMWAQLTQCHQCQTLIPNPMMIHFNDVSNYNTQHATPLHHPFYYNQTTRMLEDRFGLGVSTFFGLMLGV